MEQQPRPAETVPAVESEGRTKGERTRDRILDVAYDAIIHKGFAGTSIDELVEAAGITKSGFFYHFKDKTDLAHQLIERYTGENARFLDDMAARARELSDDPLHSFLIFLKLFPVIPISEVKELIIHDRAHAHGHGSHAEAH